jgi:hypothetical protein
MKEKKEVTRRSFLKSTGTIGGALALGGAVGSLLKGAPAYAAVIRHAYPAAQRGRFMGLVRVLAVIASTAQLPTQASQERSHLSGRM